MPETGEGFQEKMCWIGFYKMRLIMQAFGIFVVRITFRKIDWKLLIYLFHV